MTLLRAVARLDAEDRYTLDAHAEDLDLHPTGRALQVGGAAGVLIPLDVGGLRAICMHFTVVLPRAHPLLAALLEAGAVDLARAVFRHQLGRIPADAERTVRLCIRHTGVYAAGPVTWPGYPLASILSDLSAAAPRGAASFVTFDDADPSRVCALVAWGKGTRRYALHMEAGDGYGAGISFVAGVPNAEATSLLHAMGDPTPDAARRRRRGRANGAPLSPGHYRDTFTTKLAATTAIVDRFYERRL